MKSIRLDFLREVEDDAGVLQKGARYLVVIDTRRHRQFEMPLSHKELLKCLRELRYHPQISAEMRRQALGKLSQMATQILEAPSEPQQMLQLDLVTRARELWALPLEAALDANGAPLFARREPAVVLTRRAPQDFADRQPNWPARPRILFASASPKWARGAAVEFSKHKDALLSALQPWVEPLPGVPMVIGQETSVLTTIEDATLVKIEQACRQAEAEKRPYTHIHLLAHGIICEDPLYDFERWYGIALCSDDETPTKPDALVQAIWPSGRQGQDMPLVVTLAICDGGNAENTIVETRGLAQELHHAGVPIVIASQLPLTFPGAETLTRMFYAGWMAGKDVRAALHDTRVKLFETKGDAHDWMSLVAWVRLPEGYNDYLLQVRLESQLAALETASNHAKTLIENDIKEDFQYNVVTERLQERIKRLEQLLDEPETIASTAKREVVGENTGQLGSAYKRLAELLANRARAVTEGSEERLTESRAALAKARDMYHKGFRRDPADHWLGVQYLVLDGILTGQVPVASWYACYVAASAQRDYPEGKEIDRIKKRIWALGSVAELGLIAPLAPGVVFSEEEGAAAPTTLSQLVGANRALFPILSPVEATRRQLRRYVDWWTKANGFFSGRDSDLAIEANQIIKLLDG